MARTKFTKFKAPRDPSPPTNIPPEHDSSPDPLETGFTSRSSAPQATVESSLESRSSLSKAPQQHVTSSHRNASSAANHSHSHSRSITPSQVENTLRSPTPPLSVESTLSRRQSPSNESQQSLQSTNASRPLATVNETNSVAESSLQKPDQANSRGSVSSTSSRKRSREEDDAAATSDVPSMSPRKRNKSKAAHPTRQNLANETTEGQIANPTVSDGETPHASSKKTREVNRQSESRADNNESAPDYKVVMQLNAPKPGDQVGDDIAPADVVGKPPAKPKRGKTPAKKAPAQEAAPKTTVASKKKAAPKKTTFKEIVADKQTPKKSAAAAEALRLHGADANSTPDFEVTSNEGPGRPTPAASTPTREDDVKSVATRASGRARAAPKRLNNEIETKPAPKQAKAGPSSMAVRKHSTRNPWTPENLLTKSSSKLVHANLVKLLQSNAAWDALDKDERLALAAMLPSNPLPPEWPAEIEVPNVLIEHVNNPTFRTDLADFQNYLELGYFEPAWLEKAAQAMERRANGDFDDWKERERDSYWADIEYEEEGDEQGDGGKAKNKGKGTSKEETSKGKGKKKQVA